MIVASQCIDHGGGFEILLFEGLCDPGMKLLRNLRRLLHGAIDRSDAKLLTNHFEHEG